MSVLRGSVYMTKKFNVHYTCANCGHATSAETGFGRWMRACPDLESRNGIVRTDTDHMILRYKTYGSREFQLLMDVEVKEYGSNPDQSQYDILAFKHQLVSRKAKNMHGSTTNLSLPIKSMMLNRVVLVRYLGVHLLQFEKTNPDDSDWIKWDRKLISKEVLIGLLSLDLNPDNPDQAMRELLRDRHKQHEPPPRLFN